MRLEGSDGLANLFRMGSSRHSTEVGSVRFYVRDDGAGSVRADKRPNLGAEETEIRRSVVEHTGKQSAAPEKQTGPWLPQLRGVCLQPVQRGHHGRENA